MLLLRWPLPGVYFCVCFAMLALPAVARADAVLLSFRPPSQGVAAGYNVYLAPDTTGPIASAPLDAGARAPDVNGVASYSIANLDPARAYVVEMTAYDSKGVESRRSNRLSIAPRVETLGTPTLSHNYDVYAPGVHVPDYDDARGDTTLTTGTNLFFVSYLTDGSRVFGTTLTTGAVRARYVGPVALDRTSAELSGRVFTLMSSALAGVAARITGDGTRYFELGTDSTGAWAVRGRNEPVLSCGRGPALGVTQATSRWHKWKLRVTRIGGLTRLRAKVWPSTTAEPAAWQADCWTKTPSAADSGSFALLRGGVGAAWYDDVTVSPVIGTLEPIPQ